jgi:hypothetical protein
MATKKTRTPKKTRPRSKHHGLRNAASVSAMPRARGATKADKEPTDWHHQA